jgi:hypothetical protein
LIGGTSGFTTPIWPDEFQVVIRSDAASQALMIALIQQLYQVGRDAVALDPAGRHRRAAARSSEGRPAAARDASAPPH